MLKRENKFRAWTGMEMEYRLVVGRLGAFYVEGIDPKDSACMSPFNTKYSDQVPIMQFADKHDKNGKEIYEGDIVRYTHFECCPENSDVTETLTVEWRHNGWSPFNYLTDEAKIEVIGNIYENPELV